MSSSAQGIPGLPDLTNPIELVNFGTRALKASLLLVFLIVALTLISIILLILTWGFGSSRSASLAAIISTIAGAVLPIFGLLVPFSGLTLSLAGLLSAVWLAVRHWYGWYLHPKDQRL